MPQPDRSDVHVDQPLTNISIASMNSPGAFTAQQVFPRVPVVKESNKYFVFTKSFLFRSTVEVRGPTAPVKHRGYALSTGSYSANEYATGILVADRIAENSDLPLRAYEDATTIISHDMMMFIESNFGAEFMVTGTWTNNVTLAGTDQWSDYANSDPVADVDTGKFTVNGLTGVAEEDLSLNMGNAVWLKLKRHPKILAAIGGGNPNLKIVTKEMVAEILGVRQILVSQAVYNTNNEGNATQTLTRIIGKNCLIFYAPSSPSIMTPSCGYFFSKTQSEIVRYDVRRRRSQAVEISSLFDFKSTDVDAGYLLINAVA